MRRGLSIVPGSRELKFAARNTLVFGGLAVAVVMAGSANAQSGGGYIITKSTIDSGGGTVTGGEYRLSGTTGQHDAAPISGGEYALTGGFWSPIETAVTPDMPTVDPSGFNKCRFVSFSATGGGSETALRVNLVSLHHVVPPYTGGASVPFTSFEGQVRWVGPPVQYMESTSNATPFHASSLQCTPHYQDWSTVPLLHVTGSAIVPSSMYEVENVAASCTGNEASCAVVSAPLSISTTRWGDVETPYTPPDAGQPAFSDVSAMVAKFRSSSGAPIKARALLAGDDAFGNFTTINQDLSFSHIAACVDAFRGKPYPHTIAACP